MLLAALTACSAGGGERRDVVVFAAASLTGPFERIAADIEAEHPGLDVLISFDASSSLSAQIAAGSPADVFASADLEQIERLDAEGLVERSAPFALGRLQVVAPADGGAGIQSAADLARPGVRVVLAAPEVPAGDYARRMFDELGILAEVEANVVSNEQDVKDVLTKVRLGEADAGVVYATDVTPDLATEVRRVETPEGPYTRATYGIAEVRGAPDPDEAEIFYEFVLSDAGEEVLRGSGFEIP